MSKEKTVAYRGGCLGTFIAAILSAALNGVSWWIIPHMFFSWFYVLYAVLFRAKEIIPGLKAMFM